MAEQKDNNSRRYNRVYVNYKANPDGKAERYIVSSKEFRSLYDAKASNKALLELFLELKNTAKAHVLPDGGHRDGSIPMIELDSSMKRALPQKGNTPAVIENAVQRMLNNFIDDDGNYLFHPDVANDPDSIFYYYGESHDKTGNKSNGSKDTSKSDDKYKANHLDLEIKDMQIKPCFNVLSLANAFVSLIYSISTSRNDNIAMLGIFAPWGRGKTYFWKKVQSIINKHNSDKELKQTVKFKIAEFNAWKYQDEPAIWAYLFEVIFKRMSCFGRVIYTIYRHFFSILKDLILFAIPVVLTYLINSKISWKIAAIVLSSSSFILKYILNNYNSAITLIKNCTQGISFSKHLGIQAEIEKELSALLRFWIPNRKKTKKLILYVDDIDRCEHEKMLSVVESLRTIMENSDIKDRLIVICSIDSNKLAAALKIKYTDLKLSNEEINKMVYDQFDKLFISSVSLPELSINNEIEYIARLANLKTPIILPSLFSHTDASKDEDRQPFTINTDDNTTETAKEITEQNVAEIMSNHIATLNIALTPRKLSHIYYRCLFGILIFQEIQGYNVFDKNLIENIINYSLGLESEDLNEINYIVTPYPAYIHKGK